MNRVINLLEKIIEPINKWTGLIAALILLGMMLLTFADVTGRYLIRPVKDAYELTEFMLALIVFLSLGYTQLFKGHVSINFIVEKLPLKIRSITETIFYGSGLIILILMSWQMFVLAERTLGITSGRLQLPNSVFISIAGVGVVLFALTLLLEFLRSLRKVVDGQNDT